MDAVLREHPALVGKPIYLDYNATTPVDPRVVETLLPVLSEGFGNPSSGHVFADAPRRALDHARQLVADLIGAAKREIVFTGSGSEADALAIRGAVLARVRRGAVRPHVITQVTEHPAVLAACRALETEHGAEVTYLPVDRHGVVDPADVRAAVTPRTVLVSVMHANNETGTLQPIADIAEITRSGGILLHSDAAQSVGKIPVEVDDLGVDLLTIVGHKMYAPKGIAALYVRDGVELTPLVGGGGQERGLRAGTENVALAFALGEAARLAGEAFDAGEPRRLAQLRDLLANDLARRLPTRVHVHGHPTGHLPHTLNLRVDGIPGSHLLSCVPGLAASTGSACHTARDEPSDGLRVLGLTRTQALSAIRLSLGRWTSAEQIHTAVTLLSEAAESCSDRPSGPGPASGGVPAEKSPTTPRSPGAHDAPRP